MPGERWVLNASPLILLGKLRRLDIVEALASSVVVPESVVREVRTGLRKDETGSATLDWASARQVADVPLPVAIASWDLGAGESQVIAHCLAGAQVSVQKSQTLDSANSPLPEARVSMTLRRA